MVKPFVEGFDGDYKHSERNYVVGTNTGLRSWYLISFDRPLRSMSWDFFWEGRGPHRSQKGLNIPREQWQAEYPQLDNPVGFYAYYDPRFNYPGYPPNGNVVHRITGVIEGFGRCVIGSQGFRSEVATILGFTVEGIRRYEAESAQFFAIESLEDNREKKEQIREYLDKWYPEVPIFETQSDMLKMIPLSTKPNFTQYGKEEV